MLGFNLHRLFKTFPANAGCLLATRLLLEGGTIEDIAARLRKEGMTDRAAARVVCFLPSAFARVFYQETGYTFPDHFFSGMAAYRAGQYLLYRNEPIFQETVKLAEQMRRDGDWAHVELIVEISAEHRGIVAARAQGLTPLGSSIIIYTF